jgi:hypothetical protein
LHALGDNKALLPLGEHLAVLPLDPHTDEALLHMHAYML